MLRNILLSLSRRDMIGRLLAATPGFRRAVRRFVAGESFDDARRVVADLNRRGILATLDYLGEEIENGTEARAALERYQELLRRISDASQNSHVSLKLSQLGLGIDKGLCLHNVEKIVQTADEFQNFVRIDMEASAYTAATLDIFRALHERFSNVGVVIQAYLYRSAQDIEGLIDFGSNVRLCKGAYKESSAVAFPRKRQVDTNFGRLLKRLLCQDARGKGAYAAIATHDEQLIRLAQRQADKEGLSRKEFEFQMLYGIRRDLQESLVKEGYTVRSYVPFGSQWYPYFMRRLAERPANLVFLLRNLMR